MESKLSVFNDWGNEVSAGRNDVVFEGRNRAYGAFDLRRHYGKRASTSFGITLGILFFVLAIPLIIKLFTPAEDSKTKHRTKDVVTELGPPPPLEKELPPPPKLNIPKQVEQVRFVPPKVVVKPVDEPELPKNTDPPKPPPPPDATPGPDTTVYAPPAAPIPPTKKVEPYTYVEQMPTFPGGEDKMTEYLYANMKYPSMARETNIQGKVYVNFIVDEDGKINNVKVIRGIGGGCDEEAVRVVKGMPTWKPGKQNGRTVPVSFNLPIQFKLQ